MSLADTVPEAIEARSAGSVRLLFHVLSYEDLLLDPQGWGRVGDRLTLGRAAAPEAAGFVSPDQLRLSDQWMSSAHARLERRGDDVVCVDLGSRNGTWVNGTRITERVLRDGDLLEVGHSLLCYRAVDEASAKALQQPPEHLTLGPTRTRCPEMAVLLGHLGRIAASTESVLILAETGAGKEFVAQAVHQLSGRRGAFCSIDCGAVPDTLFESAMFGHRKGAFTGASEPRTGEIVRADGGTLFLDEVANMSVGSQASLLRVLEDGKVTPLGASEPLQVDVRWIAATNAELFAGDGGFRGDLLRRLAGYVARIPPLRARREDLGTLTAFLLRDAGFTSASMTVAAARQLFGSAFPGNVRQLRAALRSAALLANGSTLDVRHLPDEQAPAQPVVAAAKDAPAKSGTPTSAELEQALRSTNGNVVRTAELFSTHPRQIYRWIEKNGLRLDDFRPPDAKA